MNAIEIAGVCKSFGATRAVDGVSFEVPRGSVFGFIGPNGSGKTTTLRMIMRMILPDEGAITVLGSKGESARDRVGYLPEERGLYKKMTVRHLLAYYGRLKGAPGGRVDRNAAEWLERMGLGAYADERIESLSKGMSQKVQFIAAAVSDPELLILDEPFSGLDPVNADVLKDAVLALRARGVTIVFSTHDMAMAERLCDRICMIYKGRKVLDGTLDQIQAEYGHDTIRVRTSGGVELLRAQPEVESMRDLGNVQELRVSGDPQVILKRLVASAAVHEFAITRPALGDIFLRIAGTSGGVYRHD